MVIKNKNTWKERFLKLRLKRLERQLNGEISEIATKFPEYAAMSDDMSFLGRSHRIDSLNIRISAIRRLLNKTTNN